WEQSTVGMMCRAEITQCDAWLALEPLFKRERNVRLADAWLTRQQHYPTFSLRGVSPSAQQQLDLLFTPEQRRQLGLVHRLEPALHAARPPHPPKTLASPPGIPPPLHRNGPETAEIEGPASELARLRADQHCPWLRQRL